MRRSCLLVPALGALLAAPTAVEAVEVGDLTIGGFVDTWLEITSYDENAPDLPAPDDDQVIDFAAEVELQIGWSVGSDVHAQMDIEFYGDGGEPDLETATVTWDVSESASLMMGEFVDWLGWEAADAPGRYRINRTVLIGGNFYGAKTVTGLGVMGSPSETFSYGVYVTDMVYGATGTASDDFAIGGDFTFKIDGYGSVNVEFALDSGAAPAFGGAAEEDVTGFGINTTYDAMDGLVVGGEFHMVDYDAANAMGLMAIVNKSVSDTA